MTVTKLAADKASLKLRIKGYDLDMINALRRFCLVEVPVLAIDDVVILENSSLMYDEVLAHRLGLIPIVTPHKYLEGGEDGVQVMLVLDARAGTVTRTIYSGELVSAEDREVKPASAEIPIAELAPGQSIKLEAYAKLGRGKVHAKWQATSKAVAKPTPVVTIKNASTAKREQLEGICPVHILASKDSKLVVTNPLECTYCMECEKLDPDSISIKESKDDYIFSLESVGSVDAEDILMAGADIMMKDFKDLHSRVAVI